MTSTRMLSHVFDQRWRTPKLLYDQLDQEFHFDHDPCPPKPTQNGIFSDWGQSNFVNPPYGRPIASWLRKALSEFKKGKGSVFLIPAYTDVAWFHELVLPYASEIRFIRGRLEFGEPAPENRKRANHAPFASMIVVYRPEALIQQKGLGEKE